MNSIKNLERLQKLHLLIEQEATGSPKELATRMHVSERLVYNLIEHLRDYEAKISFDRKRKTYFYSESFHLEVNISVSVISNNQLTRILGENS